MRCHTHESAFSSVGSNFGIQSFAFNFDSEGHDGNLLSLTNPSGWSGECDEDNITGYGPYGKFDFEVKGKGSRRQNPLVFFVTSPPDFSISIDDFNTEESTKIICSQTISQVFAEGTITSAKFADPAPDPEPDTLLFLGSELLGLAGYGRMQRSVLER